VVHRQLYRAWRPAACRLRAALQLFRKEADAQNFLPLMILAHVIMSGAFVWIYARGVEARPWLGQGIRYGVAIILLTTVPLYLIYSCAADAGRDGGEADRVRRDTPAHPRCHRGVHVSRYDGENRVDTRAAPRRWL